MNINYTAVSSKTYVPIKTGGIERIRLDNNGNMGIGTTVPINILDVSGNSRLSTHTGDGLLFIGNSKINYKNTNANLYIGTGINDNIVESGNNNIAIGNSILKNNTVGTNNIAIGYNSLNLNTSGDNNVAFGYNTLYNNINGKYNTAVGFCTLQNNQIGNYNVALGSYSGSLITDGSQNIYIGDNANSNNTSVKNEIVIGSNLSGLGTNTTVIGNNSNLKTIFWNNNGGVCINGTNVSNATLEVNGTMKIRNNLNMNGYSIINVSTPTIPYSSTSIATIGFIDLCMPIGSIIMWNNGIIPNNWIICDGLNNTPNLINKFIIGTQQTTTFPSRTGGSSTITLDTNTIPGHTHTLSFPVSSTISQNTLGIQLTDGGHSHTEYYQFGTQTSAEKSNAYPQNSGYCHSRGDWTTSTSGNLTVQDSGHYHTFTFQSTTGSYGGLISSTTIPNFIIRTGGSDWKNKIINNDQSNTNIQTWGPDSQWYYKPYHPNEIGDQFKFFAAFWLSKNNVSSGSTTVYSPGNVGTYSFSKSGTTYTATFPNGGGGTQTWNTTDRLVLDGEYYGTTKRTYTQPNGEPFEILPRYYKLIYIMRYK